MRPSRSKEDQRKKVLSVVTIVEDLYGTVESTGMKIEFDKELQNTAIMNVLTDVYFFRPFS